MTVALKIAGVLSIFAGLRSLFQGDGLGFVMFCTLGAGFLIDPKPGGGGYWLKWALMLVASALALVRLVSNLAG